ncbi:MAG: hypothetical protein KatS3mg077_2301 [Candidatus Binatia bacterium]|nr:MAG: hypothetical protein KatS3mg077_2301 [Candidatus Binatia bacterium]
MESEVLTFLDHSRERAGLRYVYPVLSRRAGGLSVGVNLNPNNACNWRCVYCQVPGLRRGAAPRIDVERLEEELREFLRAVMAGDYLQRHLPPEFRVFRDVAVSGNGEPTTAREFAAVVEAIARVRQDLGVPANVKTVLITNGTQVHRPHVRAGIEKLAVLSGEVWFKVDRVTPQGMRAVNGTRFPLARVQENLIACSELCSTWIQSCWFASDGAPPPNEEVDAFVAFLANLLGLDAPVRGVLLYTLARPSAQPEANRLAPLPREWLEGMAERVRAVGWPVRVYD